MIYVVIFVLWLGIFSFFVSTPLFLNIWISIITGLIVYFLFNNKIIAFTLYMVEEGLSFFIIFIWVFLLSKFIIGIFLLIKGAFPPFHKWLIEIVQRQERLIFLWGVSFHKIPIFIFWRLVVTMEISFLVIFSTIGGAFLMWKFREFSRIFVLSSISVVGMIWIMVGISFIAGCIGIFLYVVILWRMRELSFLKINGIFFMFGLVGLPPLLIFQIKWFVIENYILIFPRISVIAFIVTILSTVGYLRILILISFNKEEFINGGIFFGRIGITSRILPILYL